MDVSRSGRVRKKSSKLADFESPDDIEIRQGGTSKKRIRDGEYIQKSLCSLAVDDLPPDQLLADDTASDLDSDEILDIKEEDFDEIPFLNVDEYEGEEDLDVGNDEPLRQIISPAQQMGTERNLHDKDIDSDEEGNLMIDDTKGRPIKRPKIRKMHVADERAVFSKKARREHSGKAKFTAFMLWAKTVRNQVEELNPGIDFAATRTRLGEMWEILPDSDKYNWKRRANTLSLKTAAVEQQHVSAQIKAKPPLSSGEGLVGNSPILAAAISGSKPHQLQKESTAASGLYKVTGTEPIDAAAHLKLLGESLSTIGERLCEHEGQIAVSGSLSVLLDSLLCATAPLLCLTQQVPELDGVPQETLKKILDNIAYIMPGL